MNHNKIINWGNIKFLFVYALKEWALRRNMTDQLRQKLIIHFEIHEFNIAQGTFELLKCKVNN